MYKYCPCGAKIRPDRYLCLECYEIYGSDQAAWPAWLRFMVSDIQREWDADRNKNVVYIDPDKLDYMRGVKVA